MPKKRTRAHKVAAKRSPIALRKSHSRTRALSTTRRTIAAKKGWITRRANARKRSIAAKKGWATRRALSRQKTQSKHVSTQSRPRTITPRHRRKPATLQHRVRHIRPGYPRSEFAVSADYRSRKNRAVTIQIAAIGPTGATMEQARDATAFKINTGRSPAGWKVRIINWRGSQWRGESIESDEKIANAWNTLSAPLALADLDVSTVGKDET